MHRCWARGGDSLRTMLSPIIIVYMFQMRLSRQSAVGSRQWPQLIVTVCPLRLDLRFDLTISYFLLTVAYFPLITAHFFPTIAYCPLPTSLPRLHTAHCILPTFFPRLPIAHCLLPTSLPRLHTAHYILPTFFPRLPTAYYSPNALLL